MADEFILVLQKVFSRASFKIVRALSPLLANTFFLAPGEAVLVSFDHCLGFNDLETVEVVMVGCAHYIHSSAKVNFVRSFDKTQ